MRIRILPAIAASIFLNLSVTAQGVTIHTWKDSNGVTHFSDEPSPNGIAGEEIVLEDIKQPAVDKQDDFYSIANQWERLKAERDKAAAARLEKRKIAAAERAHKAELDRRAAVEQESVGDGNYPTFGRGIIGPGFPQYGYNGYVPGHGLPSFGRSLGRGRHNQRPVHPNYHSPFHARAQPQAIRPKSSRNQGSRHRGNRFSTGSLYVRF